MILNYLGGSNVIVRVPTREGRGQKGQAQRDKLMEAEVAVKWDHEPK